MRGFCFLFCVTIISLFFDRILASSFQADDDHQQTNNTTHFALFVFGESLYDPGNNNFLNVSIEYKANFPPYGETFFRFPTGRYSDGRLIPDFICKLSLALAIFFLRVLILLMCAHVLLFLSFQGNHFCQIQLNFFFWGINCSPACKITFVETFSRTWTT